PSGCMTLDYACTATAPGRRASRSSWAGASGVPSSSARPSSPSCRRVGHEQNLALPHVAQRDLFALWRALDDIGVATPNVNLVSDIIACPGLDYCSLANALDPGGTGDHAASAVSISRAISAGCTSISPGASMPVATITSVTSASLASRKTARSTTK